MDRGRELLLGLPTGLDDGELLSEFSAATCSASDGDVVAEDDADGGSLEGSRNGGGEGVPNECGLESGFDRRLLGKVSLLGDDAGVGVLESRCCAENWLINESTFKYQGNRAPSQQCAPGVVQLTVTSCMTIRNGATQTVRNFQ